MQPEPSIDRGPLSFNANSRRWEIRGASAPALVAAGGENVGCGLCCCATAAAPPLPTVVNGASVRQGWANSDRDGTIGSRLAVRQLTCERPVALSNVEDQLAELVPR